jgi:serine/threonine protein kinase
LGSIGRGAYGSVRDGIHKPTGHKVAIKVYEKYKLIDPQRKRCLQKEIKVLSKLSHPNIVKLFEVIETNREVKHPSNF